MKKFSQSPPQKIQSGITLIKHEETHENTNSLLDAAKTRLHHLNKWWRRLYAWNCWLTGTSVVLSGIVPFGLGLLLYIPQENAKTLNVILIILTAIAFVAQVWNVTQKNRERAQHLRSIASLLESAIVNYETGISDIQKLALDFQEASERDAQEPAP